MKLLRLLTACALLLASATTSAAPQKAVLITGASSGLGLKMTQLLSSNGFIVYAGARKDADLKRLNTMENVEAVRLDVTVQQDIDEAVKFVESRGRGLYGLMNNAGVAVFGPSIEIDYKQLQHQFDVNVFGPYRVTQAFAPLIIESKGRIATTGSIAGVLAGSMFGPYSMSKHAIEAYTDSLAVEMQRFGVSVSVVEPGNYSSSIGKTAAKRISNSNYWPADTRYQRERNGMLAQVESGQTGPDPLAVAEAVLDIMTSDSPKRRYMVVHRAAQADATIRRMLSKTLELNQDQAHNFDRAALIKMLDEELAKQNK